MRNRRPKVGWPRLQRIRVVCRAMRTSSLPNKNHDDDDGGGGKEKDEEDGDDYNYELLNEAEWRKRSLASPCLVPSPSCFEQQQVLV